MANYSTPELFINVKTGNFSKEIHTSYICSVACWVCHMISERRIQYQRSVDHGRPFRSENPYQFEFWYVERIFGTRFAGTVGGTDFRSGFHCWRLAVRHSWSENNPCELKKVNLTRVGPWSPELTTKTVVDHSWLSILNNFLDTVTENDKRANISRSVTGNKGDSTTSIKINHLKSWRIFCSIISVFKKKILSEAESMV